MDDNRVPPADLSRDFYRQGGQYVTQTQLDAAITALRAEHERQHNAVVASMEKGFERVAAEVERSEDKWRERTHELSNTLGKHAITLALHDAAFETAEKARSALWMKVAIFVPIAAAFTAWLVSVLQRMKP
jgi:hypothetical protein